MLVASGETKVIYPVVLVKVDGITCRALLDIGCRKLVCFRGSPRQTAETASEKGV